MFSTGLLRSLPCPRPPPCPPFCPFGHDAEHHAQPQLRILPAPAPAPAPTKRPRDPETPPDPPPQRLRTAARSVPVPVPALQPHNAAPILRANAALSHVPVPVRQAMLKSLYDHFLVLYELILPASPSLASEHALRQEDQIYTASTKLTYRNAVITSIAALKKRTIPTSISHPSVGTNHDIAARAEARSTLDALRLTRSGLAHLVVTSKDTLCEWGYVTQVPDGDAGSVPHLLGRVAKCDRCKQSYTVTDTPARDECTYHWARPFTRTINGEKLRVHPCCSKTTNEDGCSRGFHVFYESDPAVLHLRQPFSPTRSPISAEDGHDTALDVVALDCEMIYTTGGMRVARVSVVDGAGSEIFDELVRMDDGVQVIDYNTRFSGLTEELHRKASLTLSSIRQSLDAFINAETIIIGHSLENDFKTLRMVHLQCVDTAILFPHRAGPPYRRSLRDLAKEHLGTSIQTGDGTTGHSSVEDSLATLDLVRWHILNKPKGERTASKS